MRVERNTEIERSNRILLERIMTNAGSRKKSLHQSFNRYKSLNVSARKQEITKIAHENQALFKRIQLKKPYYDASQWKKDYRYTRKLVLNMSKYPHQLASVSKSPKRLGRCSRNDANKLASASSFNTRLKTSNTFAESKAMTVMCRKSKEMNKKSYDIKLGVLKGKIVLSATAESEGDSISITIPSKKSNAAVTAQ